MERGSQVLLLSEAVHAGYIFDLNVVAQGPICDNTLLLLADPDLPTLNLTNSGTRPLAPSRYDGYSLAQTHPADNQPESQAYYDR